MGDPIGRPPENLIDPAKDYFTYHQQLWVFLYREEGIHFNDLTSDETHEAFARFAKAYNQGQLEAPYYTATFPKEVLEESKTTQHKWSFQTTATERRGLEALQDGVRRLTEYTKEEKKTDQNNSSIPISAVPSNNSNNSNQAPPPLPSRNERKTPQERLEERRANRRLRDHVRNSEEELRGGPKDFRERQLEKRKEEAAKVHGAARDKDSQQAGVEVSDEFLYGQAEESSFQNSLARDKQRKAKRSQQKNERIQELQHKEDARQANMLQMLGIQGVAPGQKIKIAPRNDN